MLNTSALTSVVYFHRNFPSRCFVTSALPERLEQAKYLLVAEIERRHGNTSPNLSPSSFLNHGWGISLSVRLRVNKEVYIVI